MKESPMLSVITPVLNDSALLGGLHDRLSTVAAREGFDWEWILVDDHSDDDTMDVVESLAQRDGRVRGVRLSRRHGFDAAVMCGLDEAAGDAAVVIQAAPHHPPEKIPGMIERWRAGAQVVWAVDRQTRDRAGRDTLARAQEALFRRVAAATPPAGGAFMLLDRVALETVRRFRERPLDIGDLLAWLGFRQDVVEYDQPGAPPQAGTWKRQLDRLSNTLTAFSDLPVRLGLAAGVVVLVAGLTCFVMAFLNMSVRGLSAGWILLLSGILLVGGLNLCLLGIVGEYLWRTLDASRARPRYVVERRIERRSAGPAAGQAQAPVRP